jgi:hypothetical protein
MKKLLAILGVLVAVAVAAPFAGATKPTRIPPSPISPSGLTAAVCGFPVSVEALVNKEVTTIFSDGRVQVTGALKMLLTNTTNGHSMVVNIPGPATFYPDGTFKATGPWLWWQEPGIAPGAEHGSLWLTTGNYRVAFAADNSFSLTPVGGGGRLVDLCPALA